MVTVTAIEVSVICCVIIEVCSFWLKHHFMKQTSESKANVALNKLDSVKGSA